VSLIEILERVFPGRRKEENSRVGSGGRRWFGDQGVLARVFWPHPVKRKPPQPRPCVPFGLWVRAPIFRLCWCPALVSEPGGQAQTGEEIRDGQTKGQ